MIEHKWHYCEHCNAPTVLCGNCGNNTCNGVEMCEHCVSAYEYEKKKNAPIEMLEKEKKVNEIFAMNKEELKVFEQKKDLKDFEIKAVKDQKEWLKD